MTPLQVKRLRQLFWLYFWLLIFEGALRKWLLPGLSNVLLLVRDPVALLGLMWGWPLLQQRPWRAWLQPLLWITPWPLCWQSASAMATFSRLSTAAAFLFFNCR